MKPKELKNLGKISKKDSITILVGNGMVIAILIIAFFWDKSWKQLEFLKYY